MKTRAQGKDLFLRKLRFLCSVVHLQSPISLTERSGSGHHERERDENSSNGNKDDEDDDDEDSLDKADAHQYDPERLKAFNVSTVHCARNLQFTRMIRAKSYQNPTN